MQCIDSLERENMLDLGELLVFNSCCGNASVMFGWYTKTKTKNSEENTKAKAKNLIEIRVSTQIIKIVAIDL